MLCYVIIHNISLYISLAVFEQPPEKVKQDKIFENVGYFFSTPTDLQPYDFLLKKANHFIYIDHALPL